MITIHGPAVSKIDRLDARYVALMEANLRLARKDATLWGEKASHEAKDRLNWIDLPHTSRDLLIELDALHAKYRDATRVILCGMGGSSLAPEVIAAAFSKELFVLDSTDPDYLHSALSTDLATAVVVVSSKSGSTIETASQLALFESRFVAANLNPKEHIVIVTDPDSPLHRSATEKGYPIVNADPQVGGRFSALSAFGLVPSALIGIDVSILLDSASDALDVLVSENSPAVDLAYLIAYATDQYCSFTDDGSGMQGLADWIEQLVAESTGKNGTGILPIVIESTGSPVAGKTLNIAFAGKSDLVVDAELGAQFILWEWVTALVGFALGIDPFDQPNVTEAKVKTVELLSAWSESPEIRERIVPNEIDGAV